MEFSRRLSGNKGLAFVIFFFFLALGAPALKSRWRWKDERSEEWRSTRDWFEFWKTSSKKRWCSVESIGRVFGYSFFVLFSFCRFHFFAVGSFITKRTERKKKKKMKKSFVEFFQSNVIDNFNWRNCLMKLKGRGGERGGGIYYRHYCVSYRWLFGILTRVCFFLFLPFAIFLYYMYIYACGSVFVYKARASEFTFALIWLFKY